MIKKICQFVIVAIFVINTAACKKDNEITQSQAISAELQSVIKSNHVNRVIPWDYGTPFTTAPFAATAGKIYSFSDNFVTIPDFGYTAYNLVQLKTYKILQINIQGDNGSITQDSAIILFFE